MAAISKPGSMQSVKSQSTDTIAIISQITTLQAGTPGMLLLPIDLRNQIYAQLAALQMQMPKSG